MLIILSVGVTSVRVCKIGKERNVLFLEWKRTKRSERKRTECPTLKKTVQSDNISDICNEKGEKLMSRADLELYITNFYKSLYRFDDTVQGEIDDFLGPDVLNHPLVDGSILTD